MIFVLKNMQFSSKIIYWYQSNHRKLPWRETKNPYYIWISEIILQQTRVDQGLRYYLKFVHHYPEIQDLAQASEDQILKDWQGLGYYSRARNMHEAAKAIVRDYKGHFPDKYHEIRSLKGIGDYTAAAIASIAYNLPYPVLDGNVYRVISRYFGIEIPIDSIDGKKAIMEALNAVFDSKNPGEFNQAIMEFGAMYCKPSNPDCEHCIFLADCEARKKNLVKSIPVKTKKTKIKNRYFYYMVIFNENYTYLVKRNENDIWKGLYQFPLIESDKKINPENILQKIDFKGSLKIKSISKEYKHILSHQHIYAQFILLNTMKIALKNNWQKTAWNDLENYPVPRLIQKFMEEYLDD